MTLPDGDVSYLDWAADAPHLHFTHATGFNAETYAALLTPLRGRFRVTAADQRGHGFTTLPAVPGPMAAWSNFGHDLELLLQKLAPGPVILAGHSMGAIVSMMAAAHFPERVRGLVLVEPVLVPRFSRQLAKLNRLLGRPLPNNLAEMAAKRRAIFPSFEMALSAYRGRGAFKTWPEATIADYLHGGLVPTGNGTEMQLACAPAWESSIFQNAPPGIARLARQVRCPLTLIHGEFGSTARPGEIGVIARARRDARIVPAPGTSHFLPMERPDIVQGEIERMERLTR
ncbi:MAG: alpha/beta hydrolase [Proteobacteria bacterium]|nr:alpha/beta hydrolase [Pseudomonadota bacterium]